MVESLRHASGPAKHVLFGHTHAQKPIGIGSRNLWHSVATVNRIEQSPPGALRRSQDFEHGGCVRYAHVTLLQTASCPNTPDGLAFPQNA